MNKFCKSVHYTLFFKFRALQEHTVLTLAPIKGNLNTESLNYLNTLHLQLYTSYKIK